MSEDKVKKLMEIAAKPLKKPIRKLEYSSNIYQFIAEAGIKSSERDIVPFSIIYYRYCRWCKNTNQTMKSFNVFSRDFSRKFQKSAGRRAGFFVSPEGFDLTAENEQQATEFVQDVLRGKTKKKSNRQPKTPKATES